MMIDIFLRVFFNSGIINTLDIILNLPDIELAEQGLIFNKGGFYVNKSFPSSKNLILYDDLN